MESLFAMMLQITYTLSLLSFVPGIVQGCITSYPSVLADGHRCMEGEYRNISDTSLLYCRGYCIASQECNSLSYNKFENYCLVYREPCLQAQPDMKFQLQVFHTQTEPQCVNWVPCTKNVPEGSLLVAELNDGQRDYVALEHIFTDILPGKWSLSFTGDLFYAAINDKAFETSMTCSLLVVDVTCTVAWVPYNTNDNAKLPTGSLAAGSRKSGTPLYVARVWVSSGQYGEHYVSGYYDSGTQEMYYEYMGAHAASDIELMIML